MTTAEIREVGLDRLGELLRPIGTSLGFEPTPETLETFSALPEQDFRLAALDGEEIVGGAVSYRLEIAVPGGSAPVAGLTGVGVLPTHTRRGLLRALMREHLDRAHERGLPLASLWASEGAIYGRFGYGLASLVLETSIECDAIAPLLGAGTPGGVRLLPADEAARLLPPVWERLRATVPGPFSRSPEWWSLRLGDADWQRRGRRPLQRAVLELDGDVAGYALYRHAPRYEDGVAEGELEVMEAIAVSRSATRELWRYLFSIDLVRRVKASLLPVDHPLLLLTDEPARLHARVGDGLWLRLVDVAAALSERTYAGAGRLVLGVADAFCPWNEGTYVLEGGEARRDDDAEPELRLDVRALGAVYLGGFTFAQLERAGRVEELRPEAAAHADALFRTDVRPWCPEIF